MGLSSLTRYQLFKESEGLIKKGESVVLFKDNISVANMYNDSAQLISGLENIINEGTEVQRLDEFIELFDRNARDVKNELLVTRVKNQIDQQMKEKNQYKTISIKTYFKYLIMFIADYQEEVIKENFIGLSKDAINHYGRKQTFLSYAYYDKGLTQALFYYFWVNSGYLYVNWMWDGVNKQSSVTKEKLEVALNDSDQFLFLRTPNSELRMSGNNSIRQWCAWEIGNFYTKHKEEKYYTSFYDKTDFKNDILDTFRPMKEVYKGWIRC